MSEVNYPKQYKIYKTILKLLEARSYLIPEERSNMSLEQFKQIYQNNPQNVEIFGHLINQTSIAVSLNLRRYKGEKIDKAFTQELLIKFRQFCNHIFIVARTEGKNGNLAIQKGALQQAQLASKLQQKQVHIEFFKQQNLLFNILEHQLVPQHILLNKAEKQALLDRYKIKESQLPKILLTDPVAQFLGLQRGEVVKIIRKSETAGTYITYRVAS